ncbi:endolytic transglycosylase MltG [Quisquiliibacterium transsilvanicum]|uniref:Endolytic murein transglycosylase n=1 Tax=Quisquiliibacterium transsilvanicum TaxID=1549638 RepID=A0A7W8M6Z1_9BURK|nr:endolytic transglycosylase MltG [Quisquiliibacterium transsilvanicum]MBB5270401.1 UPF0755 protein [Quisquiliibacterium transsilvanicum]
MNRILVVLIALGLLVAAGAGLAWHGYAVAPLALPDAPMRLRVERGASLAAVGASLRKQGVDLPAWRLSLAARLRGDAHEIKAGVYELAAPLSLAGLLDKLVRGDVLLFDLTVVEGWTFRQMRAALARHPELRQDSAKAADAEILARIGAAEKHPEGLFFPSTYRFSPGSSDYEIYAQAYRMMKQALEQAWAARAPGVPVATPYEALILASIVEKETGRPEDRAMVAGVFTNRLRVGMMLQSDPTTIYGLGEGFDGNLRRSDLRAPTPYNTYTRGGLPPTPIALPGRDAIAATLKPAETRALYFVARGDGSSEFSEDLAAHNRAVTRFQLQRERQ